jgi:uncharacterized protein
MGITGLITARLAWAVAALTVVAGAGTAAAVASTSSTSSAGPDTAGDRVTVSGVGEMLGTPDTFELLLSVNAHDASLTQALDDDSQHVADVVSALRAHGVPAKDIQTSDLNVSIDENPQGYPDGYAAVRSLTITLSDLSKVGQQVDAAVVAGGNNAHVDGLSPVLKGTEPLQQDARDRAFADAQAKAARYAQLAGRHLGRVVSVDEEDQAIPPQPYNGSYAAAAGPAAPPLPVDPGQQAVDVTVVVVFALS